MSNTKQTLEMARTALDRFEQRIWSDGRDLEDLTDEEAAECNRLLAAERALHEQLRQELNVPAGTPL